MDLIVVLIIGALAGWLGSTLYSGSGLGVIGNIVIGILGSFVGHWLFARLGIFLGTGLLASILNGAIGALVILVLLNLLVKKR